MSGERSRATALATAEILSALAGIRAAVDALEAQLLGVSGSPPQPEGAAPAALGPEWTTLQRAASEMGVSAETCANRCRLHGLGWRPDGGPWQVDLSRVRRWRAGQPYERLPSPDAATTRKNRDQPGCRATHGR